jgi:hypothetical protein
LSLLLDCSTAVSTSPVALALAPPYPPPVEEGLRWRSPPYGLPSGPVHQCIRAQRAASKGASGHRRRSAAAKDGAREPGRGWGRSARRRSSCPHGSRGRTPTWGLPATRARSASLSSTPRPWTRHSAAGLQRQAGARLQHELAKHRALWVRAKAVRPPGSDATMRPPDMPPRTLSTSRPYAAKAAFECAWRARVAGRVG